MLKEVVKISLGVLIGFALVMGLLIGAVYQEQVRQEVIYGEY